MRPTETKCLRLLIRFNLFTKKEQLKQRRSIVLEELIKPTFIFQFLFVCLRRELKVQFWSTFFRSEFNKKSRHTMRRFPFAWLKLAAECKKMRSSSTIYRKLFYFSGCLANMKSFPGARRIFVEKLISRASSAQFTTNILFPPDRCMHKT